MPGAILYIPSTMSSTEATALEDSFRNELTTRQAAITAAWKYYKGDHHKHLARDNSQTDDNVRINMSGLLIDKGVSGLFGSGQAGSNMGVRFEVSGAGAAQDYLNAVWDANLKDILLHNLGLNGGVSGHAFVKIVAGDPPRVINLDPSIVTAFWDAVDIDRVLWYRVQYGDKKQIREDYVRGRDDNGEDAGYWDIYKYRQLAEGGAQWEQMGEVIRWEYDWSPVMGWQNLPFPNIYYGRDDLQHGGELNDSVNFVLSNLQRIIKHHAHPKTVIIGANNLKVPEEENAPDRLWLIPNENAKVVNLELQSDLSSSLMFAQVLRRAFFDAGREVDPAGVADRLGDLTNFALRVLYGDTSQKRGTKQLLYGRGLKRVNQALLELGGLTGTVTITWPDVMPVDDLEQARALDIDTEHGLSRETYLQRRRYDPAQEFDRRANEALFDNMMEADRMLQFANMGALG